MPQPSPNSAASLWPHRWAVALACATFPLLWIGGLVTTTDSGMAVPDWPNTFGHNMFLYPLQEWLGGPADVRIEHGHRLLASLVGMITIGLVVVLWRCDDRRWVRWLGAAALVLVCLQGLLGGVRVLMNERTIAMFHGITGPLFFGMAVALAIFTSRRWRERAVVTGEALAGDGAGSAVRRLAIVTCIMVYLQIVLGAVVRHVPVATEPTTFALAVRFHLFLAAMVSLHVIVLTWMVTRRAVSLRPLPGLAWTLCGLLVLQIALGAGTWVVKFSVPPLMAEWLPPMTTAIEQGGALQTYVITAHVAVGSLLFAASLALVLYAVRLQTAGAPLGDARLRRLGAAI